MSERARDTTQHADRLREQGARLLCGVVADTGGVLRAKSVPAARIEAFGTAGMGASVSWPVFCVDNALAMTGDFNVVGDLRLVADLPAAVVLDDGFAWAPVDVCTQEGDTSALCWRDVARRQVARLAGDGVSVRAGHELEFTVLDSAGRPLGDEHRWQAYGMAPVSAVSGFLRSVVERLAAAGVEVEQVHAEYGVGQMELSLAPAGPVAAADAVLLSRTVIGRAAREAGLTVSFSPMPFEDGAGNGGHVHVSFERDGAPLLSGGSGAAGLTADGEHLVAGIVDGVADGIAVLAGSVVSAARLRPDRWAGVFACWGVENREAAVRLVRDTPGNPHGASVEVKCVDAAANPYLALGIVLGLAADGLASRTPLPEPVDENPSALSRAQALRLGVRRLPDSPESALAQFRDSARMKAVLGDLHAAVVAVRGHETETFGDGTRDAYAVSRFAWSG